MNKEEFKAIRQSVGLSQAKLADQLSLRTNTGSRSYVAKIESGDIKIRAFIAGAMETIKREGKK